jgi:hypothetical protein
LQTLMYCGDQGEFVSPRCAINVDRGETEIEVTNIGRSPLLLKQGQELNSIDEGENETFVPLHSHTSNIEQEPSIEEEELGVVLDDSLGEDQKKRLLAVLSKHKRHFRKKSDVREVSCGKLMRHVIHTGNSRPLSVAPRRVSKIENAAVNEHVQEMKKSGVVRRSDSPWSSPVVQYPAKKSERDFNLEKHLVGKKMNYELLPNLFSR